MICYNEVIFRRGKYKKGHWTVAYGSQERIYSKGDIWIESWRLNSDSEMRRKIISTTYLKPWRFISVYLNWKSFSSVDFQERYVVYLMKLFLSCYSIYVRLIHVCIYMCVCIKDSKDVRDWMYISSTPFLISHLQDM